MLVTADKVLSVLWLGAVSWVLCTLTNTTLSMDYNFIYLWAALATVEVVTACIMVDIKGKTVLITGCDSGFGFKTALHLHNMGFHVVAGCLLADAKGEGAEELRSINSDRLTVLQMDVTKKDQIHNVYKKIMEILPDGKLWGVVNNAGYASIGPAEWLPIEETRKNIEVNVLGMMTVNKYFLPLVRKSKGRIVNVASVLGRMGTPNCSTYIMTKHAVEGYSDSLRLEMKRWGVKVCTVEPGNYSSGTNFFTHDGIKRWQELMWEKISDEVKADYGQDSIEKFFAYFHLSMNLAVRNIQPVVDSMAEALTQKYPQARYCPQDFLTRVTVMVVQHLPEVVSDNAALIALKLLGVI